MVRNKEVSRRNCLKFFSLSTSLSTIIIQLLCLQGCSLKYNLNPEYMNITNYLKIQKVNEYYKDYCNTSGFSELDYYISYSVPLGGDTHKKELKELEKLKGFNGY